MQRIEKIKLNEIENTRIPCLRELDKTFPYWIGGFKNVSGSESIEKILFLITNYNFDKNYLNIIDERTFELLTEDNKKITVNYYSYRFVDAGGIIIREDNIEKNYRLINRKHEELDIELYSIRELDTGFIEIFSRSDLGKNYIAFSKDGDDVNLIFSSEELCDFSDYELFKSEFKKTEFKDINDLYYYIINNWPDLATNFKIEEFSRDGSCWSFSHYLIVENNKKRVLK